MKFNMEAGGSIHKHESCNYNTIFYLCSLADSKKFTQHSKQSSTICLCVLIIYSCLRNDHNPDWFYYAGTNDAQGQSIMA